jgi:hypothetical protein
MSHTQRPRKLAAVERDLARMCRDLDAMPGEVFDRTLARLLDELYGAHEMLCQAAASPPGASPSATT